MRAVPNHADQLAARVAAPLHVEELTEFEHRGCDSAAAMRGAKSVTVE